MAAITYGIALIFGSYDINKINIKDGWGLYACPDDWVKAIDALGHEYGVKDMTVCFLAFPWRIAATGNKHITPGERYIDMTRAVILETGEIIDEDQIKDMEKS